MTVPTLTIFLQGTTQVSADELNTFEQTCNVLTDLRAFPGIDGLQVFMRGYTAAGDGGQGDFYWNSASTTPDDSGVTCIKPTGTSGAGRWLRLTAGGGVTSITAGTGLVVTGTTAPTIGLNPAAAGVSYVAPDTATVFTEQQNFGAVAITSSGASVSWDLDEAQVASHTLTENTTLAAPTNMVNGGTYILIVTQAAAAKTMAYASAYKWPGGTAPVISTGSGAIDVLTFVSDGSHMFGTFQQNFS